MSSKCLCPIAVIIALLAPAASSQGGKDNVLILVADDLGVEKLGIYKEGPNPAPTPTIDALARRGVLFRNAYANSLCKPTRGCLMTGRYGLRTRVDVSNSGVLSLDEITIPEVLDAGHSGYAHAAIGKWHLCRQNQDSHPNDSGWSHFSGLLGAGVFDYSRWPRTVDGKTRFSSSYATTQMVDDALSWIGQQNKPWVCYLSFIAPHLPFHAPPSHLHTRNLAGKNPATDPIPFYQAMIESLDTEIARLFSSLGTSTMARTNVVFLGDNGTPKEVAQAPFIASHAKSTPYEGGINVPLIAAGPAVRSPGREVTALVSAVDLFATVAELTGVDVAKVVPPWVNLDSVSFAPYLSNPSQPDLREMVYTELFTGTDWDSVTGNGFLTVRDKRYKRIHRVFRKTSPSNSPRSRRSTTHLWARRSDACGNRPATSPVSGRRVVLARVVPPSFTGRGRPRSARATMSFWRAARRRVWPCCFQAPHIVDGRSWRCLSICHRSVGEPTACSIPRARFGLLRRPVLQGVLR